VAEPRGTNGFGYDPIFFIIHSLHAGRARPRAEGGVSHRGKVQALRAYLLKP
jgi:inosine/xanthosine triphosphate pyrophosphatase family protein